MYFFAKRLFVYYLWAIYTALNLRFTENRKKKINKIPLLLIIKRNCQNLAALRRSLLRGGRLGLGNKFVEALPVSLVLFCLNVFDANVRLITQRMILLLFKA